MERAVVNFMQTYSTETELTLTKGFFKIRLNISGKTVKVRNCRIHYQLYGNNCGSLQRLLLLSAVARRQAVAGTHLFKARQ